MTGNRPWHGKPHQKQDQIGAAFVFIKQSRISTAQPGSVARDVWQQTPQMNDRQMPRQTGRNRTRLTDLLIHIKPSLGTSKGGFSMSDI